MKIKRFYPILFLLLLCFQCDEGIEDCATVLCAGPPVIVMEILANGENVFENETYSIEDVTIEGTNANDITLSLFEDENSNTLLILENFNWEIGSNEYDLNFSSDTSIALQIEIFQSGPGGCCGNIPILDGFRVNDVPQEGANGSYTINLD
ncbi:hypothetical protein MTsPCn9_21060 [Croceitalea sp. MTPC9]|uniref:hypothetical protein n=1 Tax=unclassified Croceitalea TaxID=2632280 RepID=UPI002B3BFA59|nr:hypothetical protein MTsPCn6_25200 [Croceitalea sp. MTPC6]GMN17170.1 hypothetical protein MTsPCn9_21060 [Croceitalea sp. MTPC9]